MDNLIFDRTSNDVREALNNAKSEENLKGAYNYTDLNRVESWCEYLQNVLGEYGFDEELEIKKNWSLTDYPTLSQVNRIRGNIDILKTFCSSLLTESIVYNNTMTYEQANIIEKILYDIDLHINEMTKMLNVNYGVGFFLIKNKYISIEAKEG